MTYYKLYTVYYTLLNILWEPIMEKVLKKESAMHMYNWITFLYT